VERRKSMIEVLKDYLEYLEIQKHYSFHTIDNYKRDIEKFLQFMNDQGFSLGEVNQTLIRNFLMCEKRKGVSLCPSPLKRREAG
jgi:integrase/recombinase XerC